MTFSVLMLTKSWSVFWLCMLLAIRFWSPDNRQTMNLCIGLMSRLPVGYRTMYVTLMGHQDLQEMSGDGKDKGNSETKTVLH
ncbi:Uncharacterised protein [Klebsiella pneumoniae]|uniref:Uncharacterized protein n=1 Tax=Klebsiella pneumoniae TaxID=573 RepID=A0A378H2I9_KLEPN|nr:Uncharacterised protein [Klebsiella pneumoniae]